MTSGVLSKGGVIALWQERMITVILQIKNSYDGKIELDKQKFPINYDINHGFGTKSIKNFAKKYKVNLDYKIKQSTFEITFLFKNN